MNLHHTIALVTGGTRGIGAATALALAREGADLALVGRTLDDEAAAVRQSIISLGRRCELIQADCGRPVEATACVREAEARLGTLDTLVHAAGGPVNGGLFDLAPEDWEAAFDVHVHAIFHLCRAALPGMRARKQGSVVLIGSTAGLRGVITNVAYQTVKGSLPQLARALAREFANDNIRVNCVAPGIIRTRFHAKMSPEQYRLNLDHRIPLHREGTPEQVADLIVAIVKNDYITGETMTIDGGLTMRIA